jgi:hypothetical protein
MRKPWLGQSIIRYGIWGILFTFCAWLGLNAVFAADPPEKLADFNGDNYADLAIGVLHDQVRGLPEVGSVNVLYGSSDRLSDVGNQTWHQNNFHSPTTAISYEYFSRALAAGDFNYDGYIDLAIGVPGESIRGMDDAGCVHVLFGTSDGLDGFDNQYFDQDELGTTADGGAGFGFSLAAGDFNGDDFADLAIGIPYESVIVDHHGVVHVLYGTAAGLSKEGAIVIAQSFGYEDVMEEDDLFGYTLAAGDINGDGYDELVVGIPYEGVGDVHDAGAFQLIYGSSEGLTSEGDEFWYQGNDIQDTPEQSDYFAKSLVMGDFDGDGYDDLAVGVPGENIEGTPNIMDAGVIQVIFGSREGFSEFNQRWAQDYLDMEASEPYDKFGESLAAGDFNHDGRDDLAVGAPYEDIEGTTDIGEAGIVNVMYGTNNGFTGEGSQVWQQGVTPTGGPEENDYLGWSLAAGDFSGDGFDDLAIGVPYEDADDQVAVNSGIVHVIYGSIDGLTYVGNQTWDQEDMTGVEIDADDLFGYTLVALPNMLWEIYMPLVLGE